MENSKQNSNSKIAIIILSVLLIASIFYNFKLSNDTQTLTNVVAETKTEKDKVLQSLDNLKATYDTAIADKSAMSDELIVERDKVILLIADLKKSKNNAAALQGFKNRYFALESKMKDLIAENDNLKSQNGTLTIQRDSVQVANTVAVKANESLSAQNGELSKTIVKAQKLSVLNLKTVALKQKSSGKQIGTEKASRADILKISFTIAENTVATPGDKTYNVQVIDANNNVLGEKKIENYGEKSLTYSFTKTVNYDNKTVDIVEDLPVKDITGGTYYVNVFDKGELVSKTSFVLK